ncbi:ATP synthase assembly factor FMC1, mitochondrial [Madurella mycetomatis]|uniref:ATP synthase assembly factor FMC1, mitochondrial n=1 Tax=Madurella mycetomatis TaxID=100816 RepID=A0A175VTW8_9PEZI|nr:ATP synthase assembly factor FMC1, mitochondrial [Madurella mycetomatis]
MATPPAALRSLYRSLLRELPARPILSSPRAPLHQHLRERFNPSSAPPIPPAELQFAQGQQYLAYLRAQRTYVTLLERYNPGMGMDEEERVRLTARRVGMDLPVEYDGSGESEREGTK